MDPQLHKNYTFLESSGHADCKIQIGSGFFKPEVETQWHKNYNFLESGGHADCKNIFGFQIGTKLGNLPKISKFCKFRSTILNA